MYQEPNSEIDVPDSVLINPFKLEKWLKKNEGKSDFKQAVIKLPDANYKFLAVLHSGLLDTHEASQNLTEEIAKQIVDDNGMECYDNYRLKRDEKYTCTTAMSSFSCLILQSKHSLKAGGNYAILKLQE